MTDADIFPFDRGVRLLRGVDAEQARQARIRELWIEARRRAFNGIAYESDVAMFGQEALGAEVADYLSSRELRILRAHAAG